MTAPNDARRKVISVVTPCYNEEDNVGECRRVVAELFTGPLADYDFQHVFCDNASTDRTLERLRELAAGDKRVRVIANARNFGSAASIYNGVLAATGDACIVLMCDLQDPPELIPEFVKTWESGYEVVFGIRKKREEGLLLRTARWWYYRLVSWHAEYQIPVGACDFTLLDKRVLDSLKGFDDATPHLRTMIPYVGFRTAQVDVYWRARKKGKSKANLPHLVDVALNGLITVNRFPLRLFIFAGFVLAALSIAWAFFNLAMGLFYYRKLAAPGVMTVVVAVFFFSGVQLFMLGILGEYLGSIHSQVRRRPLIVERERINFDQEPKQ